MNSVHTRLLHVCTQDQVRRVLFCIAGQNLYFSETLALRGAP